MAETKIKYGGNNQAITITINSLANDAKRESTAVDNSTNCFFDALVQVQIATNTGADSTGDKCVYVYAYGTSDGGAAYSANASGSDAAFGTDPQQLANGRMIGVICTPTQNKTYKSDLMSIAAAFGGSSAAALGHHRSQPDRANAQEQRLLCLLPGPFYPIELTYDDHHAIPHQATGRRSTEPGSFSGRPSRRVLAAP